MSYWRQPHYDPAYDYGYPDYGRHAPSYGRSYGYEGGYGGRSHGVGGYGGGRSHRGATNRGGGGGYGGNRRHDDNRKRSFRDQSTSKSKTSSKPSAEYYFENGFRKVYPYFFTFFTNAQKRWEDKQLLDVFMEEFPTNTKENYIKGIETGSILVNDQRVPLDYTLKIGDTVSSNTHRHEDPVLDLPIEIIHEDRDLLVVNKPPGVPCNPTGRFKANSVASILQADLNLSYLKNMYHVDWQSSGLMVFAKNGKTMDNLERFIHGGYVRKQFVARVVGEFPLGKVTVDNNQEIVSHKLSLWKISKTGGKPSSTVFERITYNGKSSVVKCIPEVGRTAHQIRVHLQYLGHPIINDPVYNSEAWGPNKGKGAVYEKPMEEVIEDLSRLSKISSIGEWLDEENPILAEKAAKEAADLEKKKQEEAEKAAEAEKKATEAESEEKMAEGDGDGEKDGEEDGKMAEEDAEKEAEEDGKMTEGESEKDGAEEVKEENGKESKPDEEAADEDGKGEESEEVTAMDTSESGEPQAKRVKTDDEEEGAGDASTKVACSRYKTRGQIFVVQHKPFNVDKWNPAENCAECLKKYVEPQKDTMTLYLHAQMFESPNWQYYSKLPDWAKEDWKEPEEEEEES